MKGRAPLVLSKTIESESNFCQKRLNLNFNWPMPRLVTTLEIESQLACQKIPLRRGGWCHAKWQESGRKKRMKGGSRGTGRDGCVHSSTCHKINWGLVLEKFNSKGGGFVVIAPFRSLWVL